MITLPPVLCQSIFCFTFMWNSKQRLQKQYLQCVGLYSRYDHVTDSFLFYSYVVHTYPICIYVAYINKSRLIRNKLCLDVSLDEKKAHLFTHCVCFSTSFHFWTE